MAGHAIACVIVNPVFRLSGGHRCFAFAAVAAAEIDLAENEFFRCLVEADHLNRVVDGRVFIASVAKDQLAIRRHSDDARKVFIDPQCLRALALGQQSEGLKRSSWEGC